MEKKIVLKTGTQDVILSVKNWENLMSVLFADGCITIGSKMTKEVLTTSDDESLIQAILNNYRGRITKEVLQSVDQRFPKSSKIQWGLIAYAADNKCLEAAKLVAAHPLSTQLKKEADSIVEDLS